MDFSLNIGENGIISELGQDWDARLRVSNVEVRPEPVNLGELSGNRFHVVLRDVRGEVEQHCRALQARGFLNYFGTQRPRSTHDIINTSSRFFIYSLYIYICIPLKIMYRSISIAH